jgi:hypothetical protein
MSGSLGMYGDARFEDLLRRARTDFAEGRERTARFKLEKAVLYAESPEQFRSLADCAADFLANGNVEEEQHHLRDLIARFEGPARSSEEQHDRDTLRRRLERTLKLLLHHEDAFEMIDGETLLETLVSNEGYSKASAKSAEAAMKTWGGPLTQAFELGSSAGTALVLSPLADQQNKLRRELKRTAASLVAVGAEVEGLVQDAVPLVTFGLLAGTLPAGPRSENEELQELLIDAVVGIADTSAALPANDRLKFLAYFRLVWFIGLADAYASATNLGNLAPSQ